MKFLLLFSPFARFAPWKKAGVGLASPSRGRPKPWRSWWSRTERPRKFYDFRAWAWKCLESGRSGRDSLGILWWKYEIWWFFLGASWGFKPSLRPNLSGRGQRAGSVAGTSPEPVWGGAPKTLQGLVVRLSNCSHYTYPLSNQLRRVSYHYYKWDLFVVMLDIDWFPEGICLWFHYQDISVVFGPQTCFGWIRCFLTWWGSLRPHRIGTHCEASSKHW